MESNQLLMPLLADRNPFALTVMAGREPAISLRGTMVLMYIDGRVKPDPCRQSDT